MKRSILLMFILLLLLVACGDEEEPASTSNSDPVPSPVTESQSSPLQLSNPADDVVYEDLLLEFALNWSFEGELEENHYFDVRVAPIDAPLFGIGWTKDTRYDLMNWLYSQEPGVFQWTVAVIEGVDGEMIQEIVPPLPARTFSVEDSQYPDISDRIRDLPSGFVAEVFANAPSEPSVILFGPDEKLYVATLSGDIYRLDDNDGDGRAETHFPTYAGQDTLQLLVGMAFYEDRLYVSDSGRIGYLEDLDGDGRMDEYTMIVDGLPSWQYWGHSNNGIVFDEAGKLYVAVGATSDHGPLREELEASILRMNPDGSELEVYATGFRNPYDLTFSPDGDLFTQDNNPDSFNEDLTYLPSEELNHVREGLNYGFPDVFTPPIDGDWEDAERPIANFMPSVGSSGLVYYRNEQFPAPYNDGIFAAHWGGSGQLRGALTGYRVVFVELTPQGDSFSGEWSFFLSFDLENELSRPIDVTVGSNGDLYVAEFNTGAIIRVRYLGEEAVSATDEEMLIETGRELYFDGVEGAPSCQSCHNNEQIAPLLDNIGQIAETRVPDSSAEEYLYISIIDPNRYIVEGYNANLMYNGYADTLEDDEIQAIIAYMLSLRED